MPENDAPPGHPMNAIAKQFTTQDPPRHDSPADTAAPVEETIPPTIDDGLSADGAHEALRFSFPSDRIAPPAILIDRQLAVRWVAPGGNDPFSRALSTALQTESDRNIFAVLRKPSVQTTAIDWNGLFSFIYVLLRRTTPDEVFAAGTAAIAPHSGMDMPGGRSSRRLASGFALESCQLKPEGGVNQTPWRVFGLAVDQGTLVLMRPSRVPDAGAPRADDAQDLDRPHGDVDLKALVAVLSVRLNESHQIADTMLPDGFHRWMQDIWVRVDSIAAALGGRRVANSGAHTHYAFTPSVGRNPIFSAVCCASRINEQWTIAEGKRTDQLDWGDAIRMNMGISDGMAEPGLPISDIAGALGMPGGPMDQAALVSSVAGAGEIWITRSAVTQLPRQLIDQLVLGVEHQQRLRRNCFVRVGDHRRDSRSEAGAPDPWGLTIARIVSVNQG